ncbi:uncharacterized protein LOC109860079 [Pseudomyrmex gracilis]|uniref:uncharacterized protein LOC109860079 n=1 Tax=Pseudomyrmex gracilis TaxID=219809 RepID=UPI000995AB57|nr:uncharacterized protein LOC109860079 [Pseudomyrmex gracilis]
MSALAAEFGIRVARPVKTAELRVKGLDDFGTPEEIKEAVVATGNCRSTDVKVGRARASPSGLLTAWIQCPVSAAKKIADAGALRIEWVRAPVKVLERRPMQCHRCLRRGHVVAMCTYTAPEEDRRGRCYRCGNRDHRVAEYKSALKCPLCADLSRSSAHRLRGKNCAPIPRKQKQKAQKTANKSGSQSAPQEAPAAVSGVSTTAEEANQLSVSGALEKAIEMEMPLTQ